jgi:transposase InsO family protein
MTLDPLRVAIWRFERIAPLLDPCLSKAQRSDLVDKIASQPVVWPSGREAPIDRSTLYLWFKAYRTNPCIESLLPVATRAIKSLPERVIKPEWVTFALALIEENPERSLYVLCRRIAVEFALLAPPHRSSLHRALRVESRYHIARRTAKKGARRTRFVAAQVHQIWHADAKADFTVAFTDGTSRRVRILSILDDCSRYILAALVVESESLVATVKTFLSAAMRFGLPLCFYADRGSPYDSDLFRQALAVLGIRRINTKPRNPSAHGKIEAYHRSLHRWFITELPHQPLRDNAHLQLLLDAMIDTLYHRHVHRELKRTPADAFNNTISRRCVSMQRLHEAFLARCTLTPERKTGNVRLTGTLFRVPGEYLIPRRPLRFAHDLVDPTIAYLIDGSGKLVKLEPAVRVVKPSQSIPNDQLPIGSLSPLLETYRGRTLPRPVSGFGLPEIYQALSATLHRDVPATEAEGAMVISWLRHHGPFQPQQFTSALDTVCRKIGQGRPLTHIIEELSNIIESKGERT